MGSCLCVKKPDNIYNDITEDRNPDSLGKVHRLLRNIQSVIEEINFRTWKNYQDVRGNGRLLLRLVEHRDYTVLRQSFNDTIISGEEDYLEPVSCQMQSEYMPMKGRVVRTSRTYENVGQNFHKFEKF